MKLHRLAAVELRPAPPSLRRWQIATSIGMQVTVVNFTGSDDVTNQPAMRDMPGLTVEWGRAAERPPARVILAATQDLRLDALQGAGMSVPRGFTSTAERALSEASNLLAISCQAQHDVFSPRPYIFLEPETEEERLVMQETSRVTLPPLRPGGPAQGPGGQQGALYSGLLADRPHGIALLGAALAAGHGVAKLHELVRVFESAFAVSGNRLVDPLTDFLRSYPTWRVGYTRGEVRRWVKDLRDPATHADLRISKTVLLDPDVESDIQRIEQAAYDVLLNKKAWNAVDATRLQRWSFAAMSQQDGTILATPEARLRTHDDWDHQHAFRLNENYRIDLPSLPDSWHPIDWYFADRDGSGTSDRSLSPL